MRMLVTRHEVVVAFDQLSSPRGLFVLFHRALFVVNIAVISVVQAPLSVIPGVPSPIRIESATAAIFGHYKTAE